MTQDGHNIMLYKDARLSVEVGVGISGSFAPRGAVQPSSLPAGDVAWTLHRGPYTALGDAHAAVRGWCAASRRALAGPCWEIYGDWHEDAAMLETEVCYLLQPAAS